MKTGHTTNMVMVCGMEKVEVERAMMRAGKRATGGKTNGSGM